MQVSLLADDPVNHKSLGTLVSWCLRARDRIPLILGGLLLMNSAYTQEERDPVAFNGSMQW